MNGIGGLFLELARIFEGFPSCSRLHCAPTFLQLYPETEGDHDRETKRINGLSVFVKETEQRIERREIPQKTDKAKYTKYKILDKEFSVFVIKRFNSTEKKIVLKAENLSNLLLKEKK